MIKFVFGFENQHHCSIFYLDGKEPKSRDLLKMYVSGELMKAALNLKILIEISSYPCAFFVFNDFIIFSISSVDV